MVGCPKVAVVDWIQAPCDAAVLKGLHELLAWKSRALSSRGGGSKLPGCCAGSSRALVALGG